MQKFMVRDVLNKQHNTLQVLVAYRMLLLLAMAFREKQEQNETWSRTDLMTTRFVCFLSDSRRLNSVRSEHLHRET